MAARASSPPGRKNATWKRLFLRCSDEPIRCVARFSCNVTRIPVENSYGSNSNSISDGKSARTGKPLIESDRVEGTTVLDIRGEDIGSIKRLMIDKLSGRVAYAVMSFGGFLGIGAEEHAIPWGKLKYDTSLGGYRTDITVDELQRAPTFSHDPEYDWSDRKREQELHDHYRVPYYWGS